MTLKKKIPDSSLIESIKKLKGAKKTRKLGYKKISAALGKEYGQPINKKRVYRIMKKTGMIRARYHIYKFRKAEITPKVRLELFRKLLKFKKKEKWSWSELSENVEIPRRTLLRWNNQRKSEPKINRINTGKIIHLFEESEDEFAYNIPDDVFYEVYSDVYDPLDEEK